MLFLLTLLTGGYAVLVVRVWQAKRRGARPQPAPAVEVPVEDLPPTTAVGWPPGGDAFTAYVDEGIAALDGYLSDGHTA